VIRILESKDVGRLLSRKAARLSEAESVVRPILEAVRKEGDRALLRYARRFDRFTGKSVRVPLTAQHTLAPEFRAAVKTAAANVRAFAERQKPREWDAELQPGLKLGQVVRPLDTVAAYIPAGRYPLPSTLVMTVVPAQVAGVPNVCVACPREAPEVFGTARLLGLKQIYQMGGAQAIAAFAYGTKTVPRADRIVGPGNIYVAAAKKLLAGEVGIDFVAGPTEILIIAADGDPRHLAADMHAQAEHDDDAFALLLTPSKRLAEAVAYELGGLKNAAIVRVRSVNEAIEISNRFAPEHLSIPDASLLAKIRHAGSVFIGPHSPEAAGDYVTGPNHVLPTNGAARQRGGLAVTDYLKVISTQKLTAAALRRLAPSITTLARAEGLEWHARSVEVRVGGGGGR
jgi:histidinol dehydrogenase